MNSRTIPALWIKSLIRRLSDSRPRQRHGQCLSHRKPTLGFQERVDFAKMPKLNFRLKLGLCMIPCGWLHLKIIPPATSRNCPMLSATSALRILKVQDIPFPNSKKMGKHRGAPKGSDVLLGCLFNSKNKAKELHNNPPPQSPRTSVQPAEDQRREREFVGGGEG